MGNLLLIDKGSSYARAYKKSLKDKGWRITSVQRIKEALPHVKQGNPDIIVIDSSVSSAFSGSVIFNNLSASIPKIVLLGRDSPNKEKKAWLKCDLAFPMSEQLTSGEFIQWVNKLALYTSLKIENETVKTELGQKSKVSKLHDEIRNILASTFEIGPILTSVLKALKSLTGSRACSLLISDEPFFKMLKLRNSLMIRKQVFKKGTGIAGFVMEKGKALNVKDAQTDKRYNKTADSYGKIQPRALLCVPVIIKDRILGVIRLLNTDRRTVFSDADVHLLEHGADYVAIAIERAFLYEKLKNDELTSLYNMSYIRQAIDMEIERSKRFNSVFSLIFMDMDNFKKVNDKYGHLVGSRVIVEIAQLLQLNVRKLDIVSRYGGDEFVIILPQTSREVGFLVAERLRKLIEKNLYLKHESYSIRLTASLGVASYPYNAKKKEELLRLADNAMYSGKFLTKNVVFEAK
jgi:diguanylate cyclase (GGDEF)-like protein